MEMKFRAHETFYIRKGWLSKGLKNIHNKPNVFVDKLENPMDILGIGASMVKSLRYWMQATGLSVESKGNKRVQELTKLGERIFQNDRYIDELGSLLLIHYKLATCPEIATSWYYFFNLFNYPDFTRDEFVEEIKKYIAMEDGGEVALRSLNDDFTCIVNSYGAKDKIRNRAMHAENNIDCPLTELGLIDIVSKGRNTIYRKVSIAPSSVNPWIALAIIVEQAEGNTSVRLNDLLNKPGNIGKVFNLTAVSLIEILRNIENIDGIKIIRTAGLDIVQIKTDLDFLQCVDRYYEMMHV